MTAGRAIFLVGTAVVCLFLAYSIATAQWLPVVALLGFTVSLVPVLRWPEISLLVWLILGPTLFSWVGAGIGGRIPVLTPDRMLLVILYAVTMIRWLRHPESRIPIGRIEATFLAFAAVAGISLLVKGGTRLDYQSKGGLWNDFSMLLQGYLLPFGIFYLSKNLLRKDRHLRLLLETVAWLGFVIGAVGIFQYFTGIKLVPSHRFQVIQLNQRAVGTMSAPVEFGMLMTCSLISSIILLVRARSLLPRCAYLGAMAVMVTSVVTSQSRAVWVGLIASLAVMSIFERRFRRPLIGIGVATALALALAWPFIAETDMVRYRVLQSSSIFNRVALTATGLNMFVHRPLFGSGFGRYTFATEKWPYVTSAFGVAHQWAENPGVPHNEFLHILVLLGLAGFIPFILIFWWFWRSIVESLRRESAPGVQRDICLVACGVLVMYIMNGLAVDLLFYAQANNLLYVLLGAAEAVRLRGGHAAPAAVPYREAPAPFPAKEPIAG